MGVGQLSIGEDKGGAQVFGHNPAIQQFGEILAQRKAKQENDNKFLNDQLATNYDPGALRNDVDKQTYLKKYQDIKQQAIDAENEGDQTKRALKIAEVRQQLGNLSAWGEGSKKQGLIDKQLAMEFMKNPDHYEDDSIAKYKAGLAKQWDDGDVISNPSMVERRVDPDKMDTEYKKFRQANIEPAQWDNGTKKVYNFDGKKKEVIQQNRGIPIDGDDGAFERTLHYATATPNFKKGLADRYPDINTGNPQMDLALRTRKYMHDMGDVNGFYDKPKEISMEGEAPQRYTLAQQWNLKHYGTPNPPTTAVANAPTYEQDLSGRLANPEKREEAIGELNTAATSNPAFLHNINKHVNSDGSIDITIPAKHKFDKKAQADYDKNIGTTETDGTVRKPNPNAGRVKIQDPVTYHLDPTKPEEFDQKVKEMYNYLDDKGAAAKALTFAGKGHVIGSQGGLSQQSKGDQNKSYKTGDGKSYSHAQLLKLGYSEEKIKQYIDAGILK